MGSLDVYSFLFLQRKYILNYFLPEILLKRTRTGGWSGVERHLGERSNFVLQDSTPVRGAWALLYQSNLGMCMLNPTQLASLCLFSSTLIHLTRSSSYSRLQTHLFPLLSLISNCLFRCLYNLLSKPGQLRITRVTC